MPIDYRLFLAATLAASTASGCLPSPDIHVPDFSPVPSVDAGMPAADLRPPGDLGTAPDLAPAVRWTTEAKGVTTDIVRSVWVGDIALNQVFAVGNNGLILHRTGGTWQKEVAMSAGKPVTANLYAVTAVTSDIVYAVGETGTILRRTAGTWVQEGAELMTTENLYGVTVVTSGEVIVVGDNGLIGRRQAGLGVYIKEDTTGISGASLRAVTGTDLDQLYAVGTGAAIVQRVAGKWQFDPFVVDAADRGNYYAVTYGADGVFVAGEFGRVLRRDVTKWVREPTVAPMPPAMPHFYGVYAGAGEMFVVGGGGTVQHRDGVTKTWSTDPTGVTVNLYGVHGVNNGVVAVGEQGTLLRRM